MRCILLLFLTVLSQYHPVSYSYDDLRVERFEDWKVYIAGERYYVAESEGDKSNIVYLCYRTGESLQPPTYFGIELGEELESVNYRNKFPEFYSVTGEYSSNAIEGYFTAEVDKSSNKNNRLEINNIRFWESLKDMKSISYSLVVTKKKFVEAELYEKKLVEINEESISMHGFKSAVNYVDTNCK